MAGEKTYIKLFRSLQDWRWYQDANTMRVWIHLLLNANIRDRDFERITVHRGEIVTSYASLADSLGLSVQNVRTAIEHLKSTGEITSKAYPKFQVISIVCFDMYQSR